MVTMVPGQGGLLQSVCFPLTILPPQPDSHCQLSGRLGKERHNAETAPGCMGHWTHPGSLGIPPPTLPLFTGFTSSRWDYSPVPFLCSLPCVSFFSNFIYFWLHWVFVTAQGLSLVVASRGSSSLWSPGFRRSGFSRCPARAR